MLSTDLLLNKTFGQLTIVGYSHYNKRHYWKCLCNCGVKTVKEYGCLLSGRTLSCGCLRKRTGQNASRFSGHGEIPLKYFNQIKRRSKGIHVFSVSIEFLWSLFLHQNRKCSLSGIELTFDGITQGNHSASLDRINSSFGYIESNVQWIHKDINYLKQDYDESYFLDLCRKIVNHKFGNE